MSVVILMGINTWEATLYFFSWENKRPGNASLANVRDPSTEVRIPFVGSESAQGTLLQLYKAASMVEGHRVIPRRGRWT